MAVHLPCKIYISFFFIFTMQIERAQNAKFSFSVSLMNDPLKNGRKLLKKHFTLDNDTVIISVLHVIDS